MFLIKYYNLYLGKKIVNWNKIATVSRIVKQLIVNSKLTNYNNALFLAFRSRVMVRKLVSVDQLRLSCDFDPDYVQHTFGIVPQLSYA